MAKHAKPLNRSRADAERHVEAHNIARLRYLLTGHESRRGKPAHAKRYRPHIEAPPYRHAGSLNPFAPLAERAASDRFTAARLGLRPVMSEFERDSLKLAE